MMQALHFPAVCPLRSKRGWKIAPSPRGSIGLFFFFFLWSFFLYFPKLSPLCGMCAVRDALVVGATVHISILPIYFTSLALQLFVTDPPRAITDFRIYRVWFMIFSIFERVFSSNMAFIPFDCGHISLYACTTWCVLALPARASCSVLRTRWDFSSFIFFGILKGASQALSLFLL
ncbi:hypothetical protein C8R44DRAFT_351874 [Mycena epipterygia]|nr:hypothetical protein C8R44DRAFT_351874 [Mycena epipterygia]